MFNYNGKKEAVFAYFSLQLKWFWSVLRFIWFVQLAVTWLSNFPLAANSVTDGGSKENNERRGECSGKRKGHHDLCDSFHSAELSTPCPGELSALISEHTSQSLKWLIAQKII